MEAIRKLNKKPVGYASPISNLTDEEIDKIKIDLFKVKTNLSYNFSFGSVKSQQDSYKDAELLLTGNIDDYRKLNRYTQETVNNTLTRSEDVKDVRIYSSSVSEINGPITAQEIQKYEYIGRQMDWDFSKQAVKDEIKTMQYNQLNRLKDEKSESDIKEILKEMKFDPANFEFVIDSSRYMKFDNYDMNLGRGSNDCILVCNGDVVSSSKMAIKKITEQFFSDHETDPEIWTGGKINHNFIEQVKKDGEVKDDDGEVKEIEVKNGEEQNPRIDLSKYYGLKENFDVDADFLIGYGTTTIRKDSYAGMPLPKIVIDTNSVFAYGSVGMADLYEDFTEYVETIISAIRNEQATSEGQGQGLELLKRIGNWTGSGNYFLQ